jgi:hypothetical protein
MGDNVNDLLFRVALDDPTPLTTRVPGVDKGFAAIVEKAMAKSVADRYQSADEMLDAISEWRAQFESGAQRPITPVPPPHQLSTVTPMALTAAASSPEPARQTGAYAKARRYALAVPALAVLVFLLPIARRAVTHSEAPAPHLAAEPVETEEAEPMMPSTKLVPIVSVEPSATPVRELAPAPPPPVAQHGSPARPRKAYAALLVDAGAASDSVAVEPVAAAPVTPVDTATVTAAPAEQESSLPPLEPSAPPAQD